MFTVMEPKEFVTVNRLWDQLNLFRGHNITDVITTVNSDPTTNTPVNTNNEQRSIYDGQHNNQLGLQSQYRRR